MRFTFLVVANKPAGRLAEIGKISAMQLGDGAWGRREGPPRFQRIAFDGEKKEADWLFANCKYDFATRKFVNTETLEPFEPDDLLEVPGDRFPPSDKTGNDAVAKVLNDGIPLAPEVDSCVWLKQQRFRDNPELDERKYWLTAFFPSRKLPGVAEYIRAIKAGHYKDIRAAFQAIPKATQTTVLATLSPDDRTYIEWLCLRNKETPVVVETIR